MELSPFVFFTFILISALLAMAALKIMRAPTLPAYFIAGIFVGPNGLNILQSSEGAHFAGELGIVLLLFTIGLKFNLSALRAIRHFVFILGNMQVFITAAAITAVAWWFVKDIFIASLIGFTAAMSSTAIISQLLLENNAVTSPVGRRAIGVLLLQDIIVIPLIIIYSNEGGEHSILVTSLLLAAKIIGVIVLIILVAPRAMHYWLNWAARYGDKELFIINIVAIISLFSMLTGVFGLSYVLGAFLAGILIAETMHRHQVEQIVEPFRQLFLGFFFITLGILIDPQQLADNIGVILLATLALLAIKFPIVYGCARLTKTHRVTACRAAFLLAGSGEFGFVLLAIAQQSGVLSDELFQLLVPINMLAMIAVPLFWKKSEKAIEKLFPDDWKLDARRVQKNLLVSQHLNNHVIICGFGRTGQAIAGILRAINAQNFIALEEDHIILKAVGNTEKVIYGKGDKGDSLLAAGLARAGALIITYTDSNAAALSAQTARKLNPSVYIIAKAVTAQQAKVLQEAGADEALVEAHEAGFSLAEKSLHRLDSSLLWVLPHALENARKRKNPLLLGEFSGTQPDDKTPLRRLLGFRVVNEVNVTLKALTAVVDIVAWRRNDKDMEPSGQAEDAKIRIGDRLVLMGDDKALQEAEKLLWGADPEDSDSISQ